MSRRRGLPTIPSKNKGNGVAFPPTRLFLKAFLSQDFPFPARLFHRGFPFLARLLPQGFPSQDIPPGVPCQDFPTKFPLSCQGFPYTRDCPAKIFLRGFCLPGVYCQGFRDKVSLSGFSCQGFPNQAFLCYHFFYPHPPPRATRFLQVYDSISLMATRCASMASSSRVWNRPFPPSPDTTPTSTCGARQQAAPRGWGI